MMIGIKTKEAFGAWLENAKLLYAPGGPCAIGGDRRTLLTGKGYDIDSSRVVSS